MYGRLGSLAFLHLTEANAQRRRLADTSHLPAGEAGKGAATQRLTDDAMPVIQVTIAIAVALAIITALAVAVE